MIQDGLLSQALRDRWLERGMHPILALAALVALYAVERDTEGEDD